MSRRPPRLAEWSLAVLLPPEDRDDVLGDLHERFLQRCDASSVPVATVWYWIHVLRCVPRLLWFRARLRNRGLDGRRPLSVASASKSSAATLLVDLRYALRILVREPALSATAVAILALGVGATTTMFSISHGMLRDLPIEDAQQLVGVDMADPVSGEMRMGLGLEDFTVLRSQQTVLEDLAAFDENTFQLAGMDDSPERRSGAAISPQTFPLLRVQPILGRGLIQADEEPGAPPVIVIGEALWRHRLGSMPDVLGSVLRVDGVQRTVVGVMSEGFGFPTDQELWIPLSTQPAGQRDDDGSVRVFGRLRDGVTLEEATAELAGIGRRLVLARPEMSQTVAITVQPFIDQLVDRSGRTMVLTMLLVVSFVLVIAAGNVANLLLSRAVVRSKEVAIRMALGAGRLRVMTLLLTESLVLAVMGGFGGLLLSWLAVGWFNRVLGPDMNSWWMVIELDRMALLFTATCVLGATVVAGVVPALQASGVDLQEAMKSESAGTTSLRQGRTSRVLVVGQLALSCALLIMSGLMVRGVADLESRERGFEPTGVLTGRVDLEDFDYPDVASQRAFARDLEERLSELPGAEEVTLTTAHPSIDAGSTYFSSGPDVEGDGRSRPTVEMRWVSEGFFGFYRMTVRDGRIFDATDRGGGEPVVVVNQAMADRLGGVESVVGRQLFLGRRPTADDGMRIVGVVSDPGVSVRQGEPFAGIFMPFWETPWRAIRLGVRTNGEATAMVSEVAKVLAALDPNLPFHDVATLDDALSRVFLPQRTFGILFAAFGLAALILAAVGLYGVIAFSVNRKAREMGVRRALGASPRDILWGTFRTGLLPLGLGLLVGVGLGLLIAPFLGEALFGSDPRDPLVFSVVPLLLAAVAGLGLWIPSRRASKVDPMMALRSE